jgi:catechol 2,3-dioxygenase-like lactoylglutathione lyase family enzyme
VQRAHFILYVKDQEVSTRFYSQVLAGEPSLNVPGMTEFSLPGGSILGLMPEAGIRKLLGAALPDPGAARGTPRSELYLVVPDPVSYHRRALEAGARELSPLLARDWGHHAAYSLDPDSHVLGFARPSGDT